MDDERQSFILTIDNGPLQQQAAQARSLLEGIGEGAERGAAEADRAIDALAEAMQRVPHIKVGVEADVKTLADVKQAFRDIDSIVDQNREGIRTLEEEYQRLKAISGEQFMKGADKDYRATEQQCEAIHRVIAERERAIKEARDQAVALQEVEREMQKEVAEADKAAQTHGSLRGRLRELNVALVEMERNGQRGTEAYRRLQLEAADLADRMGDAATQTRILSDDNAGFKGVLSGITGVTGAFTAASGVISMFGSENERLAKIMANVQNLMAITVGLQQVSEMLNKDSAFSLVTLNGLKEWWAKITATQAVAATTEAAAEGTAATATTANAAAHTGLAAALHAVKTAILTLPFIGWVAAIGTAIAAVVLLTRKTDEEREAEERAKRAKEEHAKAMGKMYDTAADKAADLTEQYRTLQTEWAKLSTEHERRAWITDNATAFQALGANVSTVGDAEDFLVRNTDRVVAAFKARAIMVAAQEMQTEAYKKYLRGVMEADNSVAGGGYYNTYKGGEVDRTEAKQAGLKAGTDYNVRTEVVSAGTAGKITRDVYEATKAGIDKINAYRNRQAAERHKQRTQELKQAKDDVFNTTTDIISEQQKVIDRAGLNFNQRTNHHTPAATTTPKATPKATPKNTGETDEQREARERQERIAAYAEQIKQAQEEAELDIRQQEIDLMEESATKRLAQIDLDYDRARAENRRRREEAKSDDTDTPAEYLQQLDEYDRLAKEKHDAAVAALEEETTRTQLEAMRDYVNEYGTFAERRIAIEEETAKKIAEIRKSTDDEETKAWKIRKTEREGEDKKNKLEGQAIAAKVDWMQVFSGLGSVMRSTMKPVLDDLKAYTKTKDFQRLPADQQKAIVEQMENMRQSLGTMGTTYRDLALAMQEYQAAQQAAQEATEKHTEAEKKIADLKARQAAGTITADDFDQQLRTLTESLADTGRTLTTANTRLQTAGRQLALTTKDATQPISDLTTFFRDAGLTKFATLFGAIDTLRGSIAGIKADKLAKTGKAAEGIADAGKAAAGFSGALGKVASKLANGGWIAGIISSIISILDVLKDGVGPLISEILDSVLGAVGGIIENVLSLDLFKQIGMSLFNGVKGILNGIVEGFANMFTLGAVGKINWNASNAKKVQETTDRLTKSNEYLKTSIDSLRDVITSTSGLEAIKAGEKAKKEQQALIDNQLAILNAQMSYHGAHHSNAALFDISGDLLDLARTITGADLGSTWGSGWNTLTPEQYDAIRREAPSLWQAIIEAGKYDKSDYFKQYADLAGTVADITETTRQALANMTFDDMRDSFLSALTDMDRSAQDFTTDLAKTLRDGILKARLSDIFQADLQAIYDRAATLMEDLSAGHITEDEYQQRLATIKADYQALIERGRQQTDIANRMTGFDPTADATRQGTQKGIAQATQDSVDELNGRMTAVQGHTYEINHNTRLLLATTTDILRSTQAIERNTERLQAIEQAVSQTDRRLDDITRTGIKIK